MTRTVEYIQMTGDNCLKQWTHAEVLALYFLQKQENSKFMNSQLMH